MIRVVIRSSVDYLKNIGTGGTRKLDTVILVTLKRRHDSANSVSNWTTGEFAWFA